MFQKILEFLKMLFTPKQVNAPVEKPKLKVSEIPKFGDWSENVRVVQSALVSAGFNPGPVDGYFFTLTKSAVSAFQKSRGLNGSGEIGPKTLALLGIELVEYPGYEPPVVISEPSGGKYAKLSWEASDKSRAAWSAYLFERLDEIYESHILKIKDTGRIRNDWAKLTRSQRVNVLAEFICVTSKYESSWNPKSSSVDVGKPGERDTYSIGLMQVSVVDQSWAKPQGKSRYTYEELLTAVPNLDLALAILMRQISNTGLLILPNASKFRYFAVLLDNNRFSKVEQICAAVKAFKVLPSAAGSSEPPVIPPAKTGTPWLDYAKTFAGKKETDPEFNKFMSSKWPLVGLKSGTIATSTWAWCGLFVAVSLAGVGLKYDKGGALAMAWRDFAQGIEWKTQGIPRGAIVQLEHEGKCDSDDNHVAFADGDCTAVDLLKAGATINLYGGNQQNAAKVSTYPVRSICAVRWPEEFARPPRVLKSVNCTSGAAGSESTR